MVQRLGLHASTAEGPGSIPSRGTKNPQAARHGPKKKKIKVLELRSPHRQSVLLARNHRDLIYLDFFFFIQRCHHFCLLDHKMILANYP